MTYAEYSKELVIFNRIISRRKSLSMTIRMNRVYTIGRCGTKTDARLQLIKEAETNLAALPKPHKPKQPIGYQILVDGDFEGFYATDDIDFVKEEAEILLGNTNFTLKAIPRFRDD